MFKNLGASILLLALSGCATKSNYIPSAEEAGPAPTAVQASITEWIETTLIDPYSAKVEYVGEPKLGAIWTGITRAFSSDIESFGGSHIGRTLIHFCYLSGGTFHAVL